MFIVPEQLHLLFIISLIAITVFSMLYANRLYDKWVKSQTKIDHLTNERDTYYKLYLAEHGMHENERRKTK